MHYSQIVRALGGKNGIAPCPAHDDSNPSCSFKQGNNGRTLVHCHAGCSQRAVIEALKSRGLWEPERSPTPVERVRVPGPRQPDPIVATYAYTDERGELLYEIVRRQPTDGRRKYFQQRFPDGHGKWIWKKHPRQVLYRLPEVLEAAIVFLVEGEKDAETLRSHGFTATTNAGGCNAPWLPSFTQTLEGREVILIPDADPPGRKRVLEIARALLGRVARLIVFEPECGAKDVTEYFEQGHSELELLAGVYGERILL